MIGMGRIGIGIGAAAVLLGCAACGGSTTTLPYNLTLFLSTPYYGSNGQGTTNAVDATVEQSIGVTGYIGSSTLPGTATWSAPNAAGAVRLTWHLAGRTFVWLVAQNGQYAVPENARSAAILGIPDP